MRGRWRRARRARSWLSAHLTIERTSRTLSSSSTHRCFFRSSGESPALILLGLEHAPCVTRERSLLAVVFVVRVLFLPNLSISLIHFACQIRRSSGSGKNGSRNVLVQGQSARRQDPTLSRCQRRRWFHTEPPAFSSRMGALWAHLHAAT